MYGSKWGVLQKHLQDTRSVLRLRWRRWRGGELHSLKLQLYQGGICIMLKMEIGISILISRCLLTITEDNKLGMHDLLRDMGRAIIHEQSPKEPGKRSRLWFHEDVCDVLEKHKGTEAVEGVILVLPVLNEINLSTKAFARMHKLRLLQINCVHLTGSFEHLSEELRWLCWHNCPLKCLPSNFHLENLVALDMQYSSIKKVWQDIKFLKNLKMLNLSHSKCLTKTPHFAGLPRLKTLFLEGCTSLLEVHASIGLLDRLIYLNLKDCKSLRDLPSIICNLKSLEHLNLTGCSNLEGLPEHLGNMESLRELLADGTAIKQLPFYCGLLKNLTSLSLQGCNRPLPTKSWFTLFSSWVSPRKSPDSIRFLPSSISGLCSLRKLILRDCNLPDGEFLVDLGSLSSLQELDLSGNNFRSLPSSLSHLSKLAYLQLSNCTSLQSLPKLPPNLKILLAVNFKSVETITDLLNIMNAPHLLLSDCEKMVEIQGSKNMDSVTAIVLEERRSYLANTFKESLFKGPYEHDLSNFMFPGDEIPGWFKHQRIGSSISFDMPSQSKNNFVGMTFAAVYAPEKGNLGQLASLYIVITDKTNGVQLRQTPSIHTIGVPSKERVWVCHIPQSFLDYPFEGGEQVEISIKMMTMPPDSPLKVRKCGVYFHLALP